MTTIETKINPAVKARLLSSGHNEIFI